MAGKIVTRKTIHKKTTSEAPMHDSVDRHVGLWSKELGWLDPVKEAIFVRLAILARHAAQARRDSLDAGGLKHWQFKVLLMLRRLGPPYAASPSQLADMLGLTRGALSARLRPLEAAGLITRANDAADRRRVHVRLTPAGSEAFERHAGTEEHGEAALLSVLTAEEKQTLADLLRKLVVAVEARPGAASGPSGHPSQRQVDGVEERLALGAGTADEPDLHGGQGRQGGVPDRSGRIGVEVGRQHRGGSQSRADRGLNSGEAVAFEGDAPGAAGGVQGLQYGRAPAAGLGEEDERQRVGVEIDAGPDGPGQW
jgi:DNA-binding MarR family transcriptional regulator